MAAGCEEFIDCDLPWGTHFSLLYRSKEELLEVIIPYYRTGLARGDRCLLITGVLLNEAEARAALTEGIPRLDDYLERGQMEIIPRGKWYLPDGKFEQTKVLELWKRRIREAVARGYPGLRASGDVSWLNPEQWDEFTAYERAVNEGISEDRLVVLCTYPQEGCGMYEVMDVVRNHQFVIAKKDERWRVFENSEFRRTEQVLEMRERRYRQIVETVREGILTVDGAGRITFANQRAAEILACQLSELYGAPLLRFLNGDSRRLFTARKANLNGEATSDDWQFRRSDGTVFPGSVTAALLPEEGKEAEMVLTMMDMTERRKTEAKMARLERLNLAGQIAASLGHEVRNPMTTVRGFLQIMQSDPKHEEEREYLGLMVDELDKTNAIISEFLSLAKDKLSELRRGSLNSVITAMTPLLTAAALENGCDLIIEKGAIPEIRFDAKEIRQVLLNLVRNAIEATPAGGRITVRTGRDGGGAWLEVRDNGSGIPSNFLSKVGTPFFTTKPKGSGLGLAVCLRIAQRHAAVIDIASDSTGTVVKMRFPGAAESREEAAAAD